MANYFESEDLKKFGNIGRVNKELADKFFDYYNSTMKAGALSEREKALIALAVAHAMKCPYCIDAYTSTCLEKGADEAQMSEAVHVAAAMQAGIALVHSVQMMNHIDNASI
ncbi:MAG TPA: arsenosugar biosynthesis-associated peroxidase-like protein [Turneriella sp.]|nr:arsenosugar biosynthesis-associated peroxidase-like protein [Turneriella sp.]HNE21451.1 arsenosugar biosynthesis-associated peroxidase-like protein [Turneriella sp.]HNJ64437.1 arsenosugar biosynthesis-associated peroxidase-like protein [Turneriella sp.]HNL09386.1 arsenosugar biosynthesis-associated peroxidase-like protein [Turneriella sp.]HNL54555.1 arsenosugar biosynthesis-associated peroxidase-like protein [Turneriella sp.]